MLVPSNELPVKFRDERSGATYQWKEIFMDSVHTNAANPLRASTGTSSAGNEGLVDRLMQGAHEAVDRVGSKAAPALEKLTESASAARQSLETKADKLATVQGEMLDSARIYVRDRPFTALAAAALIGALAVTMMRTR
jgi:ElaB/YqjD/DUF883 family membrane-anchored ribosome-binding protein